MAYPTAYVRPSTALDAFQRLRVSSPRTIFDSKLAHDAQPLAWDDAETAGGGTSSTYNTGAASVTLATTAETAGTRVRQSKRRLNYQPGKSQLVLITNVVGTGQAGLTKQWGLFDAANGVGFGQDATGIYTFVRSSVSGSAVTTITRPSAWRVPPDSSAGSGGIEIDPTKAQIWGIDLEWLGVGTVRYFVVQDGIVHLLHCAHHANLISTVYMGNPNLPIRTEITATAATPGAGSIVVICSQVASEGGADVTGAQFGLRRTTALVTLSDTDLYPLIALKLKSGYLGATVVPTDFSVVCSSAATTTVFGWAWLLNPTVAGTAIAYTNLTNSALQHGMAATNATKVSAGTELASGIAVGSRTGSSANGTAPQSVLMGAKIDGTPDVLVLAVQRLTGTTESFMGAVNWQETL